MKKGNKQGFTLIELLVVVLIIGILSAIALPKYEVAVAKSRIAAMLPLAASIANAEEVYYMANGRYTTNPEELDVSIPSECVLDETVQSGAPFACGKYLWFGFDPNGSVSVNYCPYKNTWTDCVSNMHAHLPHRLAHYSSTPAEAGKRLCVVKNNSSLGKKICSNLAGFECMDC